MIKKKERKDKVYRKIEGVYKADVRSRLYSLLENFKWFTYLRLYMLSKDFTWIVYLFSIYLPYSSHDLNI